MLGQPRSTTTAVPAATCTLHPGVQTTIRCATCARPFCRDCVVSRFVTTRSSIWLCQSCAGVRRPAPRPFVKRGPASPIIGAPRARAGRSLASFTRPSGLWLAAAVAAVLTAVTYLQRMLPL